MIAGDPHAALTPSAAPLDAALPVPAESFVAPASSEQQRLWIVDRLGGEVSAYHFPQAYRISGELDVRALEAALEDVVRRHETLRTRFEIRAGQPVQVIARDGRIALTRIDLGAAGEAERDRRLAQALLYESRRPFDLSLGPLARALVVALGEREYVLLLTLHHIVTDAWSMSLLAQELSTSYAARRAGATPNFAPLELQYADYAAWQREPAHEAEITRQLTYWKAQLAGAPSMLDLSTDRPRPLSPSGCGAFASRLLPKAVATAVHDFGRARGASFFMTVLGAFEVLLHRYRAGNDLIVGSPISTRSSAQIENLIGFFVNTLPLRVRIEGHETFDELLGHVRETALSAFDHPDVPFDRLVEELKPQRDGGHLPYVNVMFIVEAAEADAPSLPGAVVTPLALHTATAKADLTLVVVERTSGLECSFEYSTDLFDATTIEAMLRHFENVLRGALADPSARIAALPMLDDVERERLVGWSRNERPYADDATVHALVSAQAARNPGAVAVTTVAEPNVAMLGERELTYARLEQRAERLARVLVARGVARGESVAVLARRDSESVVAMLAVLKAGAVYVPLDPDYPRQRLSYMLADAHARVIIAAPGTPALPADGGTVITISSAEEPETPFASCALPQTGPDDAAYIMFTSGSTGRPKAVIVPHRAIARLISGTDYVTIDGTDVMGGVSSFSFDASTFEVWGALCNGARLAILPRNVTLSPPHFAEALVEHRVTIMFLTAALFRHVARSLPAAFGGLRYLIAGGDVVDPASVEAVLAAAPPQHLLNGYGPTECTTFACTHRIIAARAAGIPLGRPIANTEAYILDSDRNLVPVGVRGELHLGGPGLALGYLNDTELTTRKFVAHPFRADARLYATGDLARHLPDGEIEFLGRTDRQVKVRGFRIEPAEVEAALRQLDGVHAAAAQVVDGELGEKRLIGYVAVSDVGVGDDGATNTAIARSERYRKALAQWLPRHLVPDAVVALSTLPIGPNGKLEPGRLPSPPGAAPVMPPRGSDLTQLALFALWERVLGTRQFGARDDFFSLGGHSLLAARLIGDVREDFGVRVPLAGFFENPTVEHLADLIRAGDEPDRALIALRTNGSLPPFFFLHGTWRGAYYARRLGRLLGNDRPFYTLAPHAEAGSRAALSIERMGADYAAVIRRTHPGPYVLSGFCNGGLVAYEAALRLESAGETVCGVIMIDAPLPAGRLARVVSRLDEVAVVFGIGETLRESIRGRLGRVAAFVDRARSRALRLAKLLDPRAAAQSRAFLRRRLAADEPAPIDDEDLQRRWARVIASYVPRRYRGPLTLLLSEAECALLPEFSRNWRIAVPQVRTATIPGRHLTCVTTHLEATAAAVRAALEGTDPSDACELASPHETVLAQAGHPRA